MLEKIDGRVEDYVVTPDGRRIGRMDHVFKDALEVKEAQLYQPSRERLVVRLVPRAGFDAEARRRLDHELRSRLGNEIAIEYQVLDAIARPPNGKLRAVISSVDAGAVDSEHHDPVG